MCGSNLRVCIPDKILGRFGFLCFFFKQKTAYEMRISDWSSDVCSSDLLPVVLDAQVMNQHAMGVVLDDAVEIERTLALTLLTATYEIGRASCRERVCQYV